MTPIEKEYKRQMDVLFLQLSREEPDHIRMFLKQLRQLTADLQEYLIEKELKQFTKEE